MAEIFKFFNSAPGDERWHYASDFADYFGSVLSSGLISNGEAVGLQVTVNTGTMTTSVNVGKAIIKGYSYENTTPVTLTHSIPEQTLDRIDRVVLRLDLKNASRFIKVFVKEGVSALEPVPPTLQRDQYIYELSLAQVRIRKNTSSIVVSDIKDERADENLCGIVQSLITVPTSVFQQQFDAWFASIADVTEQSVTDWQIAQQQVFTMWFDSVKGQLDGDVGAKLASELTTHKAEYEQHKSNNVSHDTYVTCATAGATAEKVVTANGFSLVEGARITVNFANANTATTPTLKINTEVAKPLVKADGTAFKNIKASVYSFVYSGLNFTVQGEGGEYGNVTASDVLAGKNFGTETGVQVGTLTVESIGGAVYASGEATSSKSITLNFSPSLIFLYARTNGEMRTPIQMFDKAFGNKITQQIHNYYDGSGGSNFATLLNVMDNSFSINVFSPGTYRWIAIK